MDAAHLYTTDERSADDYVLQFLAAHDGGRSARNEADAASMGGLIRRQRDCRR
jgi:hypothetical protein